VRVRPVRRLRRAVTLSEIRDDPGFVDFDLLRISRLSVMPVSNDQWIRVLSHEGESAAPAGTATEGRSGRAKASGPPRRGRGAQRRR